MPSTLGGSRPSLPAGTWGTVASGFPGAPCLLTRPAVLPPTKGTTGGRRLLVIERGCLSPPSGRGSWARFRALPLGKLEGAKCQPRRRLPRAAGPLSLGSAPPGARPALDLASPLSAAGLSRPVLRHTHSSRSGGWRLWLGSVLVLLPSSRVVLPTALEAPGEGDPDGERSLAPAAAAGRQEEQPGVQSSALLGWGSW